MSLLDIIIGVILLFNLFQGYQKGLVWTLFGLTSYIIAFLGAKWYHLNLSVWIQANTGILDKIRTFVDGRSEGFLEQFFISSLENNQPSSGLWQWMDQHFVQEASLGGIAHQGVEFLKEEIIMNIATSILNILCLLFLFIAIKVIMSFVARICNQLFKLPILSTFNKVGGLLIGAVKGLLLVVITFTIFVAMAMASPEGWAAGLIEKSVSVQMFFKYAMPFII
ncbi:CvpA family protein [Alkaliphilus crotonatoxidans]